MGSTAAVELVDALETLGVGYSSEVHGVFTPVIPPAWVGEKEFWLVFTQCCGNPRPPLNHYNFLLQRVEFSANGNAGVAA